jgi:hypothetical protein
MGRVQTPSDTRLSTPIGTEVRLACRLGWHRPELPGVWNGGYCFSRCRRCRHDLIRSFQGRWRVPRGFRIVWKTPAEAALGLLLRDVDEAGPPGPLKTHVPLQEVLLRLRDTDFMADERARGSWDGEIAVAADKAIARMDRSDFMMPRREEVRRETPREAAQPEPPLPARGPANSARP